MTLQEKYAKLAELVKIAEDAHNDVKAFAKENNLHVQLQYVEDEAEALATAWQSGSAHDWDAYAYSEE